MSLFRRPEKMDPREITALAGLQPLHDPVFSHLLESALSGRVDVYFAAVPRNAIRPFDPDYQPQRHPVGQAAIQDVVARWEKGQRQPVWVYQKGDHCVLADDYVVLEAAKITAPDYLQCWVLGRPELKGVVDVQGPLEEADVRKAIGLSEPIE
jgi:hypothetical protein